ncbi:hypothetical protein ANN_00366 [Periplaneta americana]|uniref:Uncharacterized protein n=1 Tax=Periplaneta americana TaxID=6978 RepID=A0ABQ8TQL7_PERAM|nr:hypothetical protein ANN_00366 [Periplaneta americana]
MAILFRKCSGRKEAAVRCRRSQPSSVSRNIYFLSGQPPPPPSRVTFAVPHTRPARWIVQSADSYKPGRQQPIAAGRSIRNVSKDGRTDGVRRLPNIWQKIINKGGDYIEAVGSASPRGQHASNAIVAVHLTMTAPRSSESSPHSLGARVAQVRSQCYETVAECYGTHVIAWIREQGMRSDLE